MMALPSRQVFHHPIDGSTLLPVLKPLLPYPIALYRRLQISHRSPSSYVLATFAPDTAADQIPQCFCTAWIDRSRRPETEVYIFLSGQAEETKRCPATGKEHCPSCVEALLHIMQHIAELPLPASVHDDHSQTITQAGIVQDKKHLDDYKKVTTDDYSRHISDPNLLLVGSLTQLPLDILIEHGIIRTDLPGPKMPYQKFIIRTASLDGVTTALPDGLVWGEVRQRDYEMVKARTAIPRKDKTLALLPSIAIFSESASGDLSASPIAWAFIGMDGALATLHVEPDYRGRGFAKALTAKLFNDKLRLLDLDEGSQEGGWLAHSDAALTNKESQGVAKALGGKEGWLCYWVRVDLSKVRVTK